MSDLTAASGEPAGTGKALKTKRRRWTIEVCKTCERRAEWPFCEHKTDDGSWFDLVTVQEVGRRV